MRACVAIPHYFAAGHGGDHGSLGKDPAPRIAALRSAILALHEIAGGMQAMIEPRTKRLAPTNGATKSGLDVVVVTSGGRHLLGALDLPATLYRHHATTAEPRSLGFECHAVLRDRARHVDLVGYLEDDLVVRDPQFFGKLGWFIGWAGEDRVLMPNRYELSTNAPVRKLYIDGPLQRHWTRRYRDLGAMAELVTRGLDMPLRFVPALNPHAGAFFLSAAQMERWSRQPYFLDRDQGFMGPLESAATLGILRCFEPYKAAPECAAFFEILHADNRYLDKRLRFGGPEPTRIEDDRTMALTP